MLKHLKNNFGYTLVEIVTTTAIVGALTAVAVPNFLRVKMNVNMEMVKQHLKVIGQEMNEFYNQSNPHEFPDDIETLDGDPAEELAITASLNAMDGLGYPRSQRIYIKNGVEGTTLRTCPDPLLVGISGDRCLLKIFSTSESRELMPWEGDGLAMYIFELGAGILDINTAVNYFLADPNLSQDQRAQLIADFLEVQGYITLRRQLDLGGGTGTSGNPLLERMPATLFQFIDALSLSAETNRSTYEALLPQIYQILKDRGVTMANKTATVGENFDPFTSYVHTELQSSALGQIYAQVGFEFQDSVKNLAAVEARLNEAMQRYHADQLEYLQ